MTQPPPTSHALLATAALLAAALASVDCGPVECVPSTCARSARVCGAISDGCGGRLECGTCETGLECSPGGACVKPCIPTTCAAEEKECGFVSDGCGRRLPCGECVGALICGAAGTSNMCEQPPDPCLPGAWTEFGEQFFKASCSGCHAPYAQLSNVRAERKLREVIANDKMPGNRKLPPGEKDWLLHWIDCGKKE